MIIEREILTSVLRVLDKKFKIETLSCDLCIQHIKTSKSNFFLHKSYHLFPFFESLTSALRVL